MIIETERKFHIGQKVVMNGDSLVHIHSVRDELVNVSYCDRPSELTRLWVYKVQCATGQIIEIDGSVLKALETE